MTLSAPLLKASNGTAYFLGWNYCPQDRTLYIVNAASNRLAANAAFQVYAVNVQTQQQTLYTLTNQTGVELAGGSAGTLRSGALTQNLRAARPLEGYVYDGHVYLRSYAKTDGLYRYFKIALDDAGDVTEIDCAGLQLPYVNDACAGRLYCYAGGGIGGGAYGTVLDTARDRLRRIEVYSGEADWFKRFDIRGPHGAAGARAGRKLRHRRPRPQRAGQLPGHRQRPGRAGAENRRQNHEGDVYFAAHSRSLKALLRVKSSEFL